MNRYLLDVNVLMALMWPRHQFHAAAHTWFSKSGSKAWATNPLTQLGVLRLLANPVITQGAVKIPTAIAALQTFTRHPAHEFWPLNVEIPSLLLPNADRLDGHNQLTDIVLLRHAAERGGILATFDTGLGAWAGKELHGNLHVLKP